MTKCIILDMDGTIANCEHRRHYVQNHNWPAFFDNMHLDTVYEHTYNVVMAMYNAGYDIVVVTARPNESDYQQKTIDWLAKFNIPYAAMYMRNGGDYRKDSIVKMEILDQILKDGWEPEMAFDDRNQVVAMWREMGIPVLQVNDGDFDNSKPVSKYDGKCLLHMMVGPSGAGKSTYIKANYKTHDVVSSDQIRVEIFGDMQAPEAFTPEGMSRTWKYVHGLVKTRLDCGVFTVLDATNVRAKDRKAVVDIVPKGQLVQYVVVDRPYNDKLATRGWRPEWLVEKHHNTMKQNMKLIKNADGYGNVMVDLTNFKADYR